MLTRCKAYAEEHLRQQISNVRYRSIIFLVNPQYWGNSIHEYMVKA